MIETTLNNLNINIDNTLLILGIVFIAMWLAAILGLWKSWYWRNQKALVYGYIFLGLAFIFGNSQDFFLALFGNRSWTINAVYIVLLFMAVFVSFNPPRILKPYWVQQIEMHPRWVYKAMAKEALSTKGWQAYFKSDETLQKWIKEIKKRPPKKTKK